MRLWIEKGSDAERCGSSMIFYAVLACLCYIPRKKNMTIDSGDWIAIGMQGRFCKNGAKCPACYLHWYEPQWLFETWDIKRSDQCITNKTIIHSPKTITVLSIQKLVPLEERCLARCQGAQLLWESHRQLILRQLWTKKAASQSFPEPACMVPKTGKRSSHTLTRLQCAEPT